MCISSLVSNMLRSIIFLVLYLAGFISSNNTDYDDWSVDENALFPTLPIAAPRSENDQCRKDSRMLMAHLKNKTYWAMQMWDASAKSDFGILYGNMYQLGSFDECMLVKEPIETQFCLTTVMAYTNSKTGEGDPYNLDPDPYSVVWEKFKDSRVDPSKYPRDNVTRGLCIPASCTRQDINESLNHHVELLNSKSSAHDPKYVVHIGDDWYCTSQAPLKYSWSEISFWTTLACLIGAQIITTIFDLSRKSESKAGKLLLSFSITRNFSSLVRMRGDESQLRQLRILYAVKFLSILFIIIDHRGLITSMTPVINFQGYETFTRSAQNLFTLHGDLVVDTFFYISGLLSCYALLEIYTKKFVNPLFVIFGRWCRLAPLYYFLVWFNVDGLMRLGSGPIWRGVLDREIDKCKNTWWLNLLFLNNYLKVEDACMVHSWFISCEMHLFVISVVLVILISKYEKLGVCVLGILAFITTLIPGIITYLYRLKPLILFYFEFLTDVRGGETWQLLYVPTHSRASVYLIGMITGYIIYKTKATNKKLPANCGGPLLILSLGLLFSPMAYGSLYYDPRRNYSVVESSIFAIFRRFSWALGCFVFMMVNCFGRNIILIVISRTRLYLFLSKLTYSIYLLHLYMQMADVATIRTSQYFSSYHVFVASCSDIILSIIYGIVLCLFIELPFKKFFHELLFTKVTSREKKKIEEREHQTHLKYLNKSCDLENGNTNPVNLC